MGMMTAMRLFFAVKQAGDNTKAAPAQKVTAPVPETAVPAGSEGFKGRAKGALGAFNDYFRTPFKAPFVDYIHHHNPHTVLDYPAGQKPLFPNGAPVNAPQPFTERFRKRWESRSFENLFWPAMDDMSYADYAAPYLKPVGGEEFVNRQKLKYNQAVQEGRLPPNLHNWELRNKKVPIKVWPDMGPLWDLRYKQVVLPTALGSLTFDKEFKGKDRRVPMEDLSNRKAPLPFRLFKKRILRYNALDPDDKVSFPGVLGHELGHSVFDKYEEKSIKPRFKNSTYQSDIDYEGHTAILNGINAARYLTGHKLDTPQDISRLLDEIEANPKLLEHFKDMPDMGRVFRSYLNIRKKYPKHSRAWKKAISVLGAEIADKGRTAFGEEA